MLSIEEARKHLPNNGKDLTDEQVKEIRDNLYELANIIFDKWLHERNEAKKNKSDNSTQPISA